MNDQPNALKTRELEAKKLISPERVEELANNITGAASYLNDIARETGLTVPADKLAAGQLQARKNLATVLMRTSDVNVEHGRTGLNSEDIKKALTVLVHADLISATKDQEAGYNPNTAGYNRNTHDLSVLAAAAASMVRAAIEAQDPKEEMKSALIQLIEHAGEHALDSFVNQVHALLLSSDDSHNSLAEDMLVLATERLIQAEPRVLEAIKEASKLSDVELADMLNLQIIELVDNFGPKPEFLCDIEYDANDDTFENQESDDDDSDDSDDDMYFQSVEEEEEYFFDSETDEETIDALEKRQIIDIRSYILDNHLVAAILESESMKSTDKVNIIRFIFSSIGRNPKFKAAEDIQISLIPEAQANEVNIKIDPNATANMLEDLNKPSAPTEEVSSEHAPNPEFNIADEDEL